MIRLFFIIAVLLLNPLYSNAEINKLFPLVNELPGGKDNWIMTVDDIQKISRCSVYSATYAYFTDNPQPLFDIPRNNIYSANMRVILCPSSKDAIKLYDKFVKVGDEKNKRFVGVGDKGVLYLHPASKTQKSADYYLNALFRYIVLQVHSDDGFVVMDMTNIMAERLEKFLSGGKSGYTSNLTLNITKKGYDKITDIVNFSGKGSEGISLKGVVYDQYNSRVSGADVFIAETGKSLKTDNKGEFNYNLGDSKGKFIEIFKVLTLPVKKRDNALESGYYHVDIDYKTSAKVGQDTWNLFIKNGNISGFSLNKSDGKKLFIKGSIDGNNISVVRACGASVLGNCEQKFQAVYDNDSFKGVWSGAGGGGQWILYKNSYEYKNILLTPKEAGFVVKGDKGDSSVSYKISNSIKKSYLRFSPTVKEHSDFFLHNANLSLDITGTAGEAILGFYGLTDNKSDYTIALTPPVKFGKSPVNLKLDITDDFRLNKFNAYGLKIYKTKQKNLVLNIKPSIELVIASPIRKAAFSSLIKSKFITFNGTDLASNIKAPVSNNIDDIVIEVDVTAFGTILKDVEIKSIPHKRTWSTIPGNIYPGVIIVSSGKVINKADGTIEYPFEKFNEILELHIDRGTLKKEQINEFEIKFILDGSEVNNRFTIK